MCAKHVPPICIHYDKSKHIYRRRHNTIKQLLSIRITSIDYVKLKDN